MCDHKIAKTVARAATSVAAVAQTMMAYATVAMADGLEIKTYSLDNNIGATNPEVLILGLAIWISRLIGTGMLIWGIYGYVTARKDGEAESMNGALGKLISGLVLICMPTVLKGLNIIA